MDSSKNQFNPGEFLAGVRSGLSGPTMVFCCDGEIAPLVSQFEPEIFAYAIAGDGPLPPPPRENVHSYKTPDFIDRVKVLTGGRGFTNVIVLVADPEAVKFALGVAAVLGTVFLPVGPGGPTEVDLHNTIHYKNLRVVGGR